MTFSRPLSPSSRTAATTSAGSSDSIAIVRTERSPLRKSVSSAMQPPNVKCRRVFCTGTATTPGLAAAMAAMS